MSPKKKSGRDTWGFQVRIRLYKNPEYNFTVSDGPSSVSTARVNLNRESEYFFGASI